MIQLRKSILLTALTFTCLLILVTLYNINSVPPAFNISLSLRMTISAYITCMLLTGPIAIPATLILYTHPYVSIFLLIISTIPGAMILVRFWQNKKIHFVFRGLGIMAWVSFGVGQMAYLLTQFNI